MTVVNRTEAFIDWIQRLRDERARARIVVRLDRLASGNPGQVALIGEGVTEMKIDYGPGYRVYYMQTGADILLLLCGGGKSSQARDIEAAKEMAQEVRRSQ